MSKQTGFTLIELMIVIAVMGAMLLASASLTGAWIDRSQVNGAKENLEGAVLQAKTLALRNAGSHLFNTPSVSVCIDYNNDQISVIQLGANASNLCEITGNTLLKTYSIAQNISFKQNNNTVECLVVNSIGMLIHPVGSSCVSSFSDNFSVGKNNESTEFKLL